MKLWAAVELENLPGILTEGFADPNRSGLAVHLDPTMTSEEVIEKGSALAFVRVEIPDDEINQWLTSCPRDIWGDVGDLESNLEYRIENGELNDQEAKEEAEYIESIRAIENATQNIEVLGYACLRYDPIPPEMLSLADPQTMLDAVFSGDLAEVRQALDTVEVRSFSSLGPQFWVWLMVIINQILTGGYAPAGEIEQAEAKADARRERMQVARRHRGRKRKKKVHKPSSSR